MNQIPPPAEGSLQGTAGAAGMQAAGEAGGGRRALLPGDEVDHRASEQ
jgi:hypothetical protein